MTYAQLIEVADHLDSMIDAAVDEAERLDNDYQAGLVPLVEVLKAHEAAARLCAQAYFARAKAHNAQADEWAAELAQLREQEKN